MSRERGRSPFRHPDEFAMHARARLSTTVMAAAFLAQLFLALQGFGPGGPALLRLVEIRLLRLFFGQEAGQGRGVLAEVECVHPPRLHALPDAGGSKVQPVTVAADSHDHSNIKSLHQLNDHLIEEIEHFFVSYNAIAGKVFKPVGRFAAKRARELVEAAAKA